MAACEVRVRALAASDIADWARLRAALWPDADAETHEADGRAALARDPPISVFVALDGDDAVIGFIEVSLRSFAEGCASSPVPYVEGWYVADAERGRGVGAALMRAAESWARGEGHRELGSDARADNDEAHHAHAALGFETVEALVVFRKPLH